MRVSDTDIADAITSYDGACKAHSSLFQLKDVALATHRVYAYSFEGQDGHDDDGEFSASKQILQSLKAKGITNYYVCVTRLYGRNMGKNVSMFVKIQPDNHSAHSSQRLHN